MTRLSHRDPVPESLRGAIVALGNFDGFHLGHQAVVREAVEWARAEGRPAIVATFDPHPVRHFAPHVPPFRLTSLDQREALVRSRRAPPPCWCSNSTTRWPATTAEGFVRDLLAEQIGAAGVVTGEDFTFGKDRGGNTQVLARSGRDLRDRGARHRPGGRWRAGRSPPAASATR